MTPPPVARHTDSLSETTKHPGVKRRRRVAAFGFLATAVFAILRFRGKPRPAVIGSAVVGAAAGARIGHALGGVSRSDAKELGD